MKNKFKKAGGLVLFGLFMAAPKLKAQTNEDIRGQQIHFRDSISNVLTNLRVDSTQIANNFNAYEENKAYFKSEQGYIIRRAATLKIQMDSLKNVKPYTQKQEDEYTSRSVESAELIEAYKNLETGVQNVQKQLDAKVIEADDNYKNIVTNTIILELVNDLLNQKKH